MKRMYKSMRWENEKCWIELRVHLNGGISGHYKSFDGMTYENLPDIAPNGNICVDSLNTLASLCLGVAGNDSEKIQRNQELISELQDGAKELISRLKITLHDQAIYRENETVNATVEVSDRYIEIGIQGYGECSSPEGEGTPILIERYNGEVRVLAFNDINNTEPVVIGLEKAREELRHP